MTRRVVISVTDDHLSSVTEVAAALEQRGVAIDAVHDLLGTIAGTCADDAVAALQDVPGVAAVELERNVTPQD